jgi:hypothetical protein
MNAIPTIYLSFGHFKSPLYWLISTLGMRRYLCELKSTTLCIASSQDIRMVQLFNCVTSNRWKHVFVHFPVLWLIEQLLAFCPLCHTGHMQTVVFNNGRFVSSSAFISEVVFCCGYTYVCSSMHTSHLIFLITTAMTSGTLTYISPWFKFSVVLPKSSGISLRFCLRVPQHLIVHVCRS